VTAAETAPDADEGTSLQDEVDELHAIVARQRAILTGVANALRGDPGPLASHGHHDLAERAASTVAALAVATREVATLRAAYALDLDGLRAEVRRANDERAAWRERVEAAEREALRLRGFLPPVAVVVCPACGVDITADLDDDGAYVTRRHSRREPARVGAGEIVWCDGGIVRACGAVALVAEIATLRAETAAR
jgi:hypothetical protein